MATKKSKEAPKENVTEEKQAIVVTVEFTQDEKDNKNLREGRVEEYEVKANELDFIHAEIEQVYIDQASGKKKSKPNVHKWTKGSWENFRTTARMLGYNHVRVLHAPDGVSIEIKDPVTKPQKKK